MHQKHYFFFIKYLQITNHIIFLFGLLKFPRFLNGCTLAKQLSKLALITSHSFSTHTTFLSANHNKSTTPINSVWCFSFTNSLPWIHTFLHIWQKYLYPHREIYVFYQSNIFDIRWRFEDWFLGMTTNINIVDSVQ